MRSLPNWDTLPNSPRAHRVRSTPTLLLELSVWLILALLLISERSFAVSVCSEQTATPTAFSIDSIQVRLQGESEFRDIESSNFCYTTQDFQFTVPGAEGLGYYYITLNTKVTSLTPDYPDGTEYKVTLTNLESARKLGGVIAVADETRAVYGDENGGSGDQITVAVKSIDSSGDFSCSGLGSSVTFPTGIYIATVPSNGQLTSSNEQRVINSKSPLNPLGFPLLYFDSESVQFSVDYTFQGCRNEDKAYDSFIDGFYPTAVLAKAGLSGSLLSFLDDEVLPLLFSTSASEGMKVTSLQVRKSYGERQSVDGSGGALDFTGLVIRMELQNDGWSGLQKDARAATRLGTLGGSGGFRIKKSARTAIKACASKKKMKKGYIFKRKGSSIACQRKKKRS